MEEIRAKFIKAIDRTKNVKSFRFTKPYNFSFQIGQYVQVIFDPVNRSNRDLNKMLSISCGLAVDYLEVTKKLSESDFSKALINLKEGDEVLLKGPMGKCTVDQLSDSVCFLIGGIGITPVFPMLEYVTAEGMEKEIILIYGNWTEEDIVFKQEINALIEKNSKIKCIDVLEETAKEDACTIQGMITKEVIERCVDDYLQKDFFIFGPPKMVAIMKNLCEKLGIEKEKIKEESFLGY